MPIKKIEKDTRAKLKKIMDGMLYHCMDLANFMAETVQDPYFETEEGKRMKRHAMKICAEHSMACIEFMMAKELENNSSDEDGDKKPIDIEQILKDML